MPNMSNDARERFIDEVSRQLTPWGVPAAAARLYAYLLLSPEPASLDQIASCMRFSAGFCEHGYAESNAG